MARESCNLDNNENDAEILPPPPPPAPASPLFPLPAPPRPAPPPPAASAASAPAADATESLKSGGKAEPPAKPGSNRCSSCRKRVGLLGFRCRCGDLFCGRHRHSAAHGCGFDYKTAGREEIIKNNPLIRAAKIIKI